MDPRIQALADLITEQQMAEYNRKYPDYAPGWAMHATATIKAGSRYTRIDVGLGAYRSGKYMIDAEGNIYGIKSYGVLHRGHWYGTLDTIEEYYWGGYTAFRRDAGPRIVTFRQREVMI